jgi:hypothetical protein
VNARIYNLCGRVHLGPTIVCQSNRMRATCEACGEELTMDQRAQIHRTWEAVRVLLHKHKQEKGAKR